MRENRTPGSVQGSSGNRCSYCDGLKEMYHNLPPHIFKKIQDAIRRPEGTFTFNYQSPDLFDKGKPGGIIFEIPSGQHLFRLERDNDLQLHFYHSSPGTGTRVATIDLNNLPAALNVFMAFSWTPNEIKLHIGPKVANGELASATGVASQRQFRIGRDGRVYQIGDHGVEVMGVSFYQAGKPIVLPTAKEAWSETVKAIEMLSTGVSTEGYMYEVVVTNLTLAILVTGFEAYTKKRFLELEQEGIDPNTDAIIDTFFPKREREAGIKSLLEEEARDAGITVMQHIVARGVINFQNFKNCKRAYNKAYGLKFGELDVPANTIKSLQSYIKYRHKIIHISALLGMLNQEDVPPEEPVFPKKETSQTAKEYFNRFIETLHQATLELRPKP